MNITLIVTDIIMLVLGIALCFRGITWYKIFQVFVGAVVCGYIGIIIQQCLHQNNVFYIVPVLVILGIIFSVKFYNASLRFCSGVIGFYVVIRYYIKIVAGMLRQVEETVVDTKDVFMSIMEIKSVPMAFDFFDGLISARFNEIRQLFSEAVDIMRTGLIIAGAVAVLVGIIVVYTQNYMIMVITASLGALYITGVMEDFIYLPYSIHFLILVSVTLTGFVYQMRLNKKKK